MISYSTGEGVDPATVGITPEINSTDPFCPSPTPFLLNTNSSTAVLRGDELNGAQPENAGVYTCYSNGLPRDTVEIIVLGELNFHDSFCNDMNLYTLFIAVPSEASSVSEAFFRFSTLSLTQIFGDQVIVSNCIEALETLVSGEYYIHYWLCKIYAISYLGPWIH